MSWHLMVHEAGQLLAQQQPPAPPSLTVPNPAPQLPDQVQKQASTMIGILKGILVVVTTGAFVASAIMIAIGFRHRRQTSQEGMFGVGWGLLALLVGGLAATLTQMLPVQ